ncbi:hypothetical protein KJ673_02195 [Patescibacteria group bacterium]|nr:hypothetical protein [Patescibacteria group bacterium]MCG2687361.1 hypothetical protein [Candidatus Parcubacteria bacterium]
MSTQNQPQLLCDDKVDPKTKKHLLVCSMNVRRQAGRHITEPIQMILKGNYIEERPRLHKILDILAVIVITTTLVALGYLLWPKNTPDFIVINASVAPEPITSGDLSTLTFEYENNSDENIRNAQLTVDLPEHFELTAVESNAEQIGQLTFYLGDIAPTEYGFIHIEGAMFGDVGGEQVFTTSLYYSYSPDNISDIKIKQHVFEPYKSALKLDLELPDTLVAYQELDGEIHYTNTGSITLPQLIIDPQWPKNFVLLSSTPSTQSDGFFHVKQIEPGETGTISFTGRLGSEQDSIFIFDPSFSFDETRYKQTQLSDTVEILPSPIQITHAISESAITPGSSVEVEAVYKNVSNYELSDITLKIKSGTDIFSTSGITNGHYANGYFIFDESIDALAPGQQGTLLMTIPVNSSLSRSRTQVYENISVETTSYANFTFSPDEQAVNVRTTGSSFALPLSSPIVLSSFGRYWGPSGDQLGRGPIPPIVGETTKYWIFWNISGTTNSLSNLNIQADLGQNVTLTGRQSVSTGSSVEEANGTVTWSISELPPTLPPASSVVGIAFEVAFTPNVDQVNQTPILISQTSISAKDAFTSEMISRSASGVTTQLPYDTKASQYGGTVAE